MHVNPYVMVIFQFFVLRQFLDMFEVIKAFRASLNIVK